MNENYILALDPSLTAFGWVVMYQQDIMASGAIKTSPSSKKQNIRKGDDRCRRITEINNVLLNIINQYNIKFIVSEQPHGSQSAVSAVMIGIVLGIVQTISDVRQIPLEWYLVRECKQNLLGKASATKEEVIQASRRLFRYRLTGIKYVDEAVCDALAVYYYAMNYSSILKMLRHQ